MISLLTQFKYDEINSEKELFIARMLIVLFSITPSQKGYANEVDSTFTIAYQLLDINFDSAFQIVENAGIDIDLKSEKEQCNYHHQAAIFYGQTGSFNLEAEQWKKTAKLLPVDSDTLYKVVYRKGRAYLNSGNFDKAYIAFNDCKVYAEINNDQKLLQLY
ncbi:MAG: hypothetical protein AB8B74_06585 [Crocinitomicaceae bacterium]